MRIFQGTFETGKRAFIGAFSSCIMVPLTLINRSPYDIETSPFFRANQRTGFFMIGISVMKELKPINQILQVSVNKFIEYF